MLLAETHLSPREKTGSYESPAPFWAAIDVVQVSWVLWVAALEEHMVPTSWAGTQVGLDNTERPLC